MSMGFISRSSRIRHLSLVAKVLRVRDDCWLEMITANDLDDRPWAVWLMQSSTNPWWLSARIRRAYRYGKDQHDTPFRLSSTAGCQSSEPDRRFTDVSVLR